MTLTGEIINCSVLLSRVDVANDSYLQATVRDVTKDKLKEQEFKSIFWDSPLSIIKLDSDHRYLSINPSFEKFIGFTEVELQSNSFLDLTHPDDRNKWQEKIETFVANGDKILKWLEIRFFHKSGRIIWGKSIKTSSY